MRIVFVPCPLTAPASIAAAFARRIVVKVGSALLVDQDTGRVNRAWLETLVEDLLRLRKRGQQVILVSSGAIALGRRQLGLAKGPLQAGGEPGRRRRRADPAGACLQGVARGSKVTVAQVLLTLEDSERRRRYLNARATLETLLASRRPAGHQRERHRRHRGDPLRRQRPARRARRADGGADCLVLLSDVDGLYTADPNKDPDAQFIDRVRAHHAGNRGDGRAVQLRMWVPAAWPPRSWRRRSR